MIKANEIWADVIGWEGFYKISTEGNIYSKRNKKYLKPGIRGKYLSVTLAINKQNKRTNIHRLIALNFIPNPLNKPCVNHIDGNKYNNRADNLEWVTYSENERHSFDLLGKNIKHSEETKQKIRNKSTGRDMSALWKSSADKRRGKPAHNRVFVYQYSMNGNFIKKFDSYTDAAIAVKGTPTAFSALKIGRLKTYKSFLWQFHHLN